MQFDTVVMVVGIGIITLACASIHPALGVFVLFSGLGLGAILSRY